LTLLSLSLLMSGLKPLPSCSSSLPFPALLCATQCSQCLAPAALGPLCWVLVFFHRCYHQGGPHCACKRRVPTHLSPRYSFLFLFFSSIVCT
jgi:hypothetical protein